MVEQPKPYQIQEVVAPQYKPQTEGIKGEAVTEEVVSAETPSYSSGIYKPTSYAPPSYTPPSYTPPYKPPPYKPPPYSPPTYKSPTSTIEAVAGLSPGAMASQKRWEAFDGSLGWRQGFGVWAIKSPYKRREDIAFFTKPPRHFKEDSEGAGSAYRTIQRLTGKVIPEELKVPLGIFNITVRKPDYHAGKKGSISYKQNKSAMKGRSTGLVTVRS
jgi:hypothetical protein